MRTRLNHATRCCHILCLQYFWTGNLPAGVNDTGLLNSKQLLLLNVANNNSMLHYWQLQVCLQLNIIYYLLASARDFVCVTNGFPIKTFTPLFTPVKTYRMSFLWSTAISIQNLVPNGAALFALRGDRQIDRQTDSQPDSQTARQTDRVLSCL